MVELTPRQRRAFELIGAGATDKQIEQQMGISNAGVRFHINALRAHFAVEGARELVARYWQEKFALTFSTASAGAGPDGPSPEMKDLKTDENAPQVVQKADYDPVGLLLFLEGELAKCRSEEFVRALYWRSHLRTGLRTKNVSEALEKLVYLTSQLEKIKGAPAHRHSPAESKAGDPMPEVRAVQHWDRAVQGRHHVALKLGDPNELYDPWEHHQFSTLLKRNVGSLDGGLRGVGSDLVNIRALIPDNFLHPEEKSQLAALQSRADDFAAQLLSCNHNRVDEHISQLRAAYSKDPSMANFSQFMEGAENPDSLRVRFRQVETHVALEASAWSQREVVPVCLEIINRSFREIKIWGESLLQAEIYQSNLLSIPHSPGYAVLCLAHTIEYYSNRFRPGAHSGFCAPRGLLSQIVDM